MRAFHLNPLGLRAVALLLAMAMPCPPCAYALRATNAGAEESPVRSKLEEKLRVPVPLSGAEEKILIQPGHGQFEELFGAGQFPTEIRFEDLRDYLAAEGQAGRRVSLRVVPATLESARKWMEWGFTPLVSEVSALRHIRRQTQWDPAPTVEGQKVEPSPQLEVFLSRSITFQLDPGLEAVPGLSSRSLRLYPKSKTTFQEERLPESVLVQIERLQKGEPVEKQTAWLAEMEKQQDHLAVVGIPLGLRTPDAVDLFLLGMEVDGGVQLSKGVVISETGDRSHSEGPPQRDHATETLQLQQELEGDFKAAREGLDQQLADWLKVLESPDADAPEQIRRKIEALTAVRLLSKHFPAGEDLERVKENVRDALAEEQGVILEQIGQIPSGYGKSPREVLIARSRVPLREIQMEINQQLEDFGIFLNPQHATVLGQEIRRINAEQIADGVLARGLRLSEAERGMQREVQKLGRNLRKHFSRLMAERVTDRSRIRNAVLALTERYPELLVRLDEGGNERETRVPTDQIVSDYVNLLLDPAVQRTGWTPARIAQWFSEAEKAWGTAQAHLRGFPRYRALLLKKRLPEGVATMIFGLSDLSQRKSFALALDYTDSGWTVEQMLRDAYYFVLSNIASAARITGPGGVAVVPNPAPLEGELDGERIIQMLHEGRIQMYQLTGDKRFRKKLAASIAGGLTRYHPWFTGPALPEEHIQSSAHMEIWAVTSSGVAGGRTLMDLMAERIVLLLGGDYPGLRESVLRDIVQKLQTIGQGLQTKEEKHSLESILRDAGSLDRHLSIAQAALAGNKSRGGEIIRLAQWQARWNYRWMRDISLLSGLAYAEALLPLVGGTEYLGRVHQYRDNLLQDLAALNGVLTPEHYDFGQYHGVQWDRVYRDTVEDWKKFVDPADGIKLRFAAGLEESRIQEQLAGLVRKAEKMEGAGAVVLDAAELERVPELVPVIRQFQRFAPRLILLGESDLARRLAAQVQGVQYVSERSPDAVTTALEQIGGRGLGGVSFFGPAEASTPVRVAAAVLQLQFERLSVSIEMILRGFGVDPELAAQLAPEIGQALGLGREA